ncbi:MAG: hypothetical protein KC486_33930 [Myxococcales bacterium]|nr:hypothetical protein [Myxococcales bacterium]
MAYETLSGCLRRACRLGRIVTRASPKPAPGRRAAGLGVALVALALAAPGCSKFNPAFIDDASAFDSGTTTTTGGDVDTTGGDGSGAAGGTADATSTTSVSGSATDSGGEITTGGATDPGSSTSGGASTGASAGTTTTTGTGTDGCDVPCDGGGSCVDGDIAVAINCVDGCEVEKACAPTTACEVVEEVAKCVEVDLCAMIDAAYQALVEDPNSAKCVEDGDCQALVGACELPSAQCWEALNSSVSQEELDDLGQAWMDANCGGDCNCEGDSPAVICENGACQPA